MQEIPKRNNIQYFKVGHQYCQICVRIEVANLLRILLSKVTNEVLNYKIECGLYPSSDRVPTVDDQPYCIEDLVMEIQNYIKYMWVLNSKTH